MRADKSEIGVVIPAHDAAGEIGACLDAVLAAGIAPEAVVVVDDGSRDQTAGIAERRGVRVLRQDKAVRPARARNIGVAALATPIVLFVDSDVVVRSDVPERVAASFAADPELAALFGSYDTEPRAPGLLSRYRNLLHHFTHQTSRREATTFWTGLGAVRRDAFDAVGGLDPAWDYLEDVDLGLRLSATGARIRLDPAIQGTHLKRWTLASMIRTDFWGRAVPWTRMMMSGRTGTGDLNTTAAAQLSALALVAGGLAILAAPFAPRTLWLALAALAVFVAANARFLGFLWRERGPLFVIGALPCHALYYAIALAGYGWVRLRTLGGRARA